MANQEQIHSKGFDMISSPNTPSEDYTSIKLGRQVMEDGAIDFNFYRKFKDGNTLNYRNKLFVLDALASNKADLLRKISRYYYRTNGIYQKIINYCASMYRFDWYISSEGVSETANEEKIVKNFMNTLSFFDNSNIKATCQQFALNILLDGIYYVYAYEGDQGIVYQELPQKYCRSRFTVQGKPAVEFNMEFFDREFLDVRYRLKILDLFPKEFKKGYILYKEKKLPADNLDQGYGSWYLLPPNNAFKFNVFGTNDLPLFINAIPALLDLEETIGIDRQKQLQQLLKIIVQELPRDKNGELLFDIEEAKTLHNNIVTMLARCIGVDVLTTFANIKAIEVSDDNQSTKDETVNNAKKTAYDYFGTSKNIFNAESNLSIEKSILADEGSLKPFLFQFESFYNSFAARQSVNKKKWNFRFYFLQTTQYNYQALSKLYKEQAQNGFSKMLPQIALGQSQSFILNTAYFENNILCLNEIMIPPLMSSTMSAEDLQTLGKTHQSNNDKNQEEIGRPKKDESELSDKTIQNKESI